RPYVGEMNRNRAVSVARVAEILVVLAFLQDDDAPAKLRSPVGGDEAGEAGPDDDDVVLLGGGFANHRGRTCIALVSACSGDASHAFISGLSDGRRVACQR